MGKIEFVKVFIYLILVVGILLLIIGVGLVYFNKLRIVSFLMVYEIDVLVFL